MVSDSELLFPREIIPAYLQDRLGPDLEVSRIRFVALVVDSTHTQIRPLASSDHGRGHIELLSVLTAAPALSEEVYAGVSHASWRNRLNALTDTDRFAYMKSCLSTYFTVVIVHKETDKASTPSAGHAEEPC